MHVYNFQQSFFKPPSNHKKNQSYVNTNDERPQDQINST